MDQPWRDKRKIDAQTYCQAGQKPGSAPRRGAQVGKAVLELEVERPPDNAEGDKQDKKWGGERLR
jgi:hypothetical protein